MRPKIQRALLATFALGMILTAMVMPRFRIVPIILAAVCLMLLATSLSAAGQLLEPLRNFQHQPLRIVAWGQPLPQTDDQLCQIESVKALGAGLHLFLKYADRKTTHLKIAQPKAARIAGDVAEIGGAAYVQWAGKKLRQVRGTPAITITVVDAPTARLPPPGTR